MTNIQLAQNGGKVEIKGYTHEDVCNSRAEKLKETWTNLITLKKHCTKSMTILWTG